MKSTITKADLNQFTGTEQYYRHWLKGIVYTDGVKYRGGISWRVLAY